MTGIIIKIILGLLLLICGVQDLLRKKIYLWAIAVGALLTIVCLPFCDNLSVPERMGGCAVGICVVIISKATRGKIGTGDGLLLCVTGLGLGFWGNLELFCIALLFAAIISIVLLTLRLADRKKSIPFIPFLLAAYVFLFMASRGS